MEPLARWKVRQVVADLQPSTRRRFERNRLFQSEVMGTRRAVACQHRLDSSRGSAELRFVDAQHKVADFPIPVAEGGRVESRRQEMVDEAFAGPLIVDKLLIE